MPTTTSQTRASTTAQMRLADGLIYLGMGVLFGVILIKSEVVSWFRIQEMFRFQAFHMYGIIGSAIVIAAASIALLRRTDATTIRGVPGSHLCADWGRDHTRRRCAVERRGRCLDVRTSEAVFATLKRCLICDA